MGSVAGQLGRAEGATQDAPGHAQLARGVPGQPAADGPPGEDDLEAGGLQHPHRSLGDRPASGSR